jgi:DNA-binding response OmpR family regulator
LRVLLAEDDPMIGASIRSGLRQDGFTVDWVDDGRAAEEALAENVHDALVLDLGLPRRTGLEILSARCCAEAPGAPPRCSKRATCNSIRPRARFASRASRSR